MRSRTCVAAYARGGACRRAALPRDRRHQAFRRPPKPAAPTTNPADQPITIESDDNDFEFDVNGNARLCGNVEMRQGDRHIVADCLKYDAASQSAKLEGGVEYSDPTMVVRGSSGDYSPTLGASSKARSSNCPSGARVAPPPACACTTGARSRWQASPSPPAPPMTWRGRSKPREIELDTETREGVGRGTKIEFKGVPLVYVPWFTFPIGDQRKSGFLFPEPGGSSRNGAELLVPYYWNIRSESRFHRDAGLLLQARRGPRRRAALPDAPATRRVQLQLSTRRQHHRSRSQPVHADPRGGAAGRMAHPHRRHRRERHRLLRGFRARTGRHERALRRAAARGHLPRRTSQRARPVPGFSDHRRRTGSRRPPLHARPAPAGLGRLGHGGRSARLRLRLRAGEFRPQHGGEGLATRRGAARGFRLVRTRLFRAAVGWVTAIRSMRSRTRPPAPTMRRRARCPSGPWTRAWCSSARADHRDSGA